MVKLLPHIFLPEYDLSISLDASLRIESELDSVLAAYFPLEADMAVMKHPSRDCTYAEAVACIRLKKDDPEVIKRQIQRYRKAGFPQDYGLVACGIMVRRHQTPSVQKHCEYWWEQVRRGSFRDQLSFNYVLWKHALVKPHLMSYERLLKNEFRLHAHNRRAK